MNQTPLTSGLDGAGDGDRRVFRPLPRSSCTSRQASWFSRTRRTPGICGPSILVKRRVLVGACLATQLPMSDDRGLALWPGARLLRELGLLCLRTPSRESETRASDSPWSPVTSDVFWTLCCCCAVLCCSVLCHLSSGAEPSTHSLLKGSQFSHRTAITVGRKQYMNAPFARSRGCHRRRR